MNQEDSKESDSQSGQKTGDQRPTHSERMTDNATLLGQEHVVCLNKQGEDFADSMSVPLNKNDDGQSHEVCMMGANTLYKYSQINEIQQLHESYDLAKNQLSKPKELLEKLTFRVPLDKLYRVVASCNYNISNHFCPVLVEIKDEMAFMSNSEMPYLLQVWNLQGECVFERPLDKPIANWNINNNLFMFQECSTDAEIWLVKLKDKKAPFVYRLKLPDGVVDSSERVNSHFDAKLGTYVIPVETKPDEESAQERDDSSFDALRFFHNIGQEAAEVGDNLVSDFDLMKSRGDLRKNSMKVAPEVYAKPSKSVSEILSREIIERAPDKMLQIDNGFLILAWRNDLVVLNIEALGVLGDDDEETNFKHIDLTNDQLQFTKLRNKYKIITLQDIGCDSKFTQICIVLEEIKTRLIRYIKIDYIDGKSQSDRRLTLSQLGVMVTKSKLQPSPLLKYRSIARIDHVTGKGYQIGIVIRENGRWEVYSDFMLVYDWYDKAHQCVDIETDFTKFYLKFVRNSHLVTETTKVSELQYELRRVGHYWRNRICFDTTKLKKDIADWDIILHRRVAAYFKIYSAILNYQMFMLVSHRNMISVYKMTVTGDKWRTHMLDGGTVRGIFIKRRSEDQHEKQIRISHPELSGDLTYQQLKAYQTAFDKYQIVVLQGINKVSYHNLMATGQMRRDFETDKEVNDEVSNRIMGFRNDEFDKFGIFILTDERDVATIEPEYKTLEGCQFYTFPYAAQNVSRTTLRAIRRGKVHDLLSSDDTDTLTPDCHFRVVKVNRKVFEFQKDEFNTNQIDNELDEVANHFKKDYIYALVITSEVNSKTSMFPLAYEKNEEGSKHFSKFYCIKNQKNTRSIEQEKPEDGKTDPHVHSFYIYDEGLGEDNTDSYFQISENKLSIYNPELEVNYSFEHLGIRNCLDIHQSYLYTMSDSIDTHFRKIDNVEDDSPMSFDVAHMASSGLWVYDSKKLLQGWIEKYKLAKAIGGVCTHLENSLFYDRLSFVKDYNNIVFVPFPHLNLLNMVGMGAKNEYLVWRQKNGFFTALDKQGELLTWSLLSGKLLYAESQKDQGSKKALQGYEVYRADDEDITYLRDFQNYEDYSIQLLYIPTAIVDCDVELLKDAMATQFKFQQRNIEKKSQMHDVAALDPDLMTSQPKIEIEVLDNLQDPQLYHFKVIKLRVHEDTGSGSEVSTLLQFAFPRLIAHDDEGEEAGNYDWDTYKNPHQRLYLSKDTKLLMEVINNFIGTVYFRIDLDKNGKEIEGTDGAEARGQTVRWRPKFRLKQFPTALFKLTSVPFLFSPNFKYQLDYNYRKEEFIIRETEGQFLYLKIPKDFLTTSWNSFSGWSAIKIICSRFQWVTDKVLRFVNESNIDSLLEICTTDPKDEKPENRYLKLLSAAKVDNLYENIVSIDSNHLILDRLQLMDVDTLPRIIRMNQQYKTGLVHATTLGMAQYKEKTGKQFDILNLINTVDYGQVWNKRGSKFDVELSYTILDWKIAETVISNPNFDISDVEEEQRTQLCFNIWPRGWGLLHMLSTQGIEQEKKLNSHHGDFIKAWENVQAMFDICENAPDLDLVKTTVEASFMGKQKAEEIKDLRVTTSLEIPVLPNIFGYTCLDYCLPGDVPKHHVDYEIFFEDKDQLRILGISENIALGGLIFQNITDYGFMHSSPFINSALLDAVTLGEEFANEFLAGSLKEVKHIFKQKTQFKIKDESLRQCSDYEYGAAQASVWEPEHNIKSQLFESTGTLQPMNLRFLDIQYLFKNTPIGRDFIHALQKCERLEFFMNPSVQIIIDNQWKYWKTLSIYFFGIPLTLHLGLFLFWSNIIIPNLRFNPKTFDTQNDIAVYLMTIISFYLLLMEIPLLISIGIQKWLQSVHSLANVANNILILINCFNEDVQSETFWGIQTYIALLIWWRFVLYLRTFTKFSWMVRLIQQSFVDIKYFVFIFFFIVLSFADAILSIQQILELQNPTEDLIDEEKKTFWEKYCQKYYGAIKVSYLTSIGEFDDQYGDYPDGWWIIFFLSTLINVIVLLNALIAITGETFTSIWESTVAKGYKEKVHQIQWLQDNLGFIFKLEVINSERLFVCQKMESDNTARETESNTQKQINKLAKDFDEFKEDLWKELEGISKVCNHIQQTMHDPPPKKKGRKNDLLTMQLDPRAQAASSHKKKKDIKGGAKVAAHAQRFTHD